MKTKYFVLILILLLASCRKTDCAGCHVPGISQYGEVPIYCLSDFNDSSSYIAFTDSLNQLYPYQSFYDRVGFCEDEERTLKLEDKAWTCNRFKD